MREINACPDLEWKQLSTEELDKTLQEELEKDYPDRDVVMPILRVLEEREKGYPVEENPDVLALLGKLNECETSSKRLNRRGWVAGIAAIAAVVCIIVMAIPRTVGAESIFDVLFRWTSSIFEFVDPDEGKNHPDANDAFVTDHIGLQQLHDMMVEFGITESVVPMWLPESFDLTEIEAKPLLESGYKVNAVFTSDEKVISISYRPTQDIISRFEKEESAVELFEAGDVSHFILENDGNLSVTWTVDGVECLMNANIAKEDVYTIIKSIYRRPLK